MIGIVVVWPGSGLKSLAYTGSCREAAGLINHAVLDRCRDSQKPDPGGISDSGVGGTPSLSFVSVSNTSAKRFQLRR